MLSTFYETLHSSFDELPSALIAAYTKVVKSKDLKLSLEIKALFLSQGGLVQLELESEQERINIAQEEINSAQTKLDSAKALLKSANGQVDSFHTQIYAEVVTAVEHEKIRSRALNPRKPVSLQLPSPPASPPTKFRSFEKVKSSPPAAASSGSKKTISEIRTFTRSTNPDERDGEVAKLMEKNRMPKETKLAEPVLPLEFTTVILIVPTVRSSTKRKAEEDLENDNPIKKAHLNLCSAPSIPTPYVDRIRKRGSIKKPLLFRLLNKLQDEQMAKVKLPVSYASFPSNDNILSSREQGVAVDFSPVVKRKTHGNNLGNKPYVRRPKKVVSPEEEARDP